MAIRNRRSIIAIIIVSTLLMVIFLLFLIGLPAMVEDIASDNIQGVLNE